ncbi:unnamed protein product [Psylliodes chrysocephalus]|uniref:thioredoxin-dependent peroxiredoxin n=1 Tax=Psylliodes chrysocephalus TaxID=3402493 RepID=A0A9P0D642_9CUCU|nr:unnamed protein product [Psylliodes chrysocephala]
MALASEKELQIDKFLNRKSSMEPQKTFDLTQWEREFREEANSDDVGEIIDCIRRFIESMIIYVLNENYQRQTLLARKCFIMLNSVLQDILLKKNLRNEFVKNVTELIFDIIIEENADYWCIKKELLKKFNSWVSQTSHDIKLQIVTGLSQMYLCKMVDNLTSYGDYELQLTIIEAIFRLYGKTEINKRLKDLIPESEELSQTFADINPSTFDEDCRLFLNNINQKHEKIFSIICDSVLVGNTVCEQPTTDINGLWVDFNICDKAVSWHYRRTAGSNETFWELITLFVSELEHFEIKSTPDMYCIQFIMSGHLITSSEEDSSFLHQSKNVIIILKRNEKAEQLVTSILPKLLDQPPPNPTKKCSRAKMAYKSLDVKVSKSANKSMLSKSEVSSMYNPLQPMPHTSNESKSVNSSKDRSANLGLIKVTSESEDEVISIASTDGSNTYLSVEDTSLIVNSQRTQILSGKCTTSDFNYRQIISSQSASQDNYLTAEGYVENSIKVSTYKNHGTNNSFTDKFKTAEEGSSENYKVQKLSSAKILKVSNKSNLNKKISNREIIEDLNSMKVNIHEYDLTEKENLIKVSQAKYKEESKPKISRNINISQKHAEEINQIRNLDDSMDFAERIICSSEVILKSDQKTSLNNILTQEVDATENTKSNLKHRKEDLSVPQDETVKNTSNLGIVTEENSSQIEILESKKEITKTPKISKKISQQKIKSAEERQIYNEIVEREQIDVIQKVSKFKNKISIVGHIMTETNAFLGEGSSKPYKNQSKRVHLVDGTAKKETFLEDVGQQKIIQRTLNTAKKISKSETQETKLAKDAETFKPGESFSNLKQTVESKTKSEQEEKICLKAPEENIPPKPVDNILQEKIERQRTMYPKRRTLESRNFIEEKTRTTKSEKSYKRRISTDEELNGVKDITKNTEIIYTEEPVMLSAEDGDEAKHKETEKNRRRYSKRSTIISTTKKITSDDEQLSDAGNIIKDTETTDIKERVIYVGDSDEEKPKETIDKKRRYSMQPTILPSDDDSHKEEPKETENSKRRYSKRPSILPPDEDLMIKDTETTDIKEPVIFVGDGDEEKSKKSDYKKRRYSKQPIIITTAEKVKSDDEDLSGAEDLIKNNKTHVGYGDKEEPMKTDKKRKYSKQPTIASPTKKITSDDKDWKTTDIKEQRNKRRYSKRPTILLDDEDLSDAKDIIKNTETADMKERVISVCGDETDDKNRRYPKRQIIKPITKINASDDKELSDTEDVEKHKEAEEKKGRYPKRRRTITLAMEKDISVNELNNEENKKEISAEDSILAKDQITQIREGNKEKNKQEYESTIEESRNLDDKKQRYSKKQSVSKKNEGYVVEKPKRDSEIINTEHIESNEGHKIKVKKSIKNKKYEKESSFKESYEESKTKDKDENNREHVMQGPKKYEDVNIEESKNVPENIDAKKWASNSDFKNKSTDNILATVLVSNINDTVENVESPILSQHLSSARCVSTTPKYNSESENINNSKKLSEKIKTAHPYSTPTSEEQLNLKVTTLTDALDNGITLSQLEAYEVPTQKNTPSVMEKSNKFQQRYIKIGNNLSDTSEEYVPLNSEIQPIIDSEKKFDNLAKQNFSEGILPIEQMNKKTDESKNDTITKSEDRIHLTPSPDKRDVDVKSHRNDFGKESQLSSSVKITSSHEKQFAQYQSQNQIKDQHENVIGDITIHPSLLSKGSVQKMVDTPLKTNGQEHLTEKVKVVQFDVKSNSNSSITTRDLNQTISTSFSARKRKLYYPDEMIVINMEDSLLEVKKPKKIIKEIQKDVSDTTIFTKRKFRTEQSEKPIKNTTKDLETISKAKSDEPKTTSCIKNNIMDEIEKHFSADVQDPKRGAVKKEGRENAQSKSFNFKINSTKRTSIGRKNVTTIGVVLDEEKQFNKTMHKRKKLNTTISSNNSMVKLKSHFERMLDSWRQDASKGSSLIDYLNDNRGKEKKGKTKISEKNRKLSIKNVKEKTRKTGKTSTPKDKRNANRALKNNSMDISNIDDEHVKRRRAKKYAPVSTMAENTKNIVDIVGKHSQRTRTNNNNNPVLIDNLNKNKQFTDSKNNENADGNMDLSIQLSLADATTKRSTDKKLKENRNKIVILSDIQLVPGNRAPQTKRSEDQYKSEVTEYISQKSNVEEPTMGHNPDPEKMWYIEGLMYQLAPSWTATALFNDKPVTIKSSDYIGKYLVLFFYPLDFCDHPYAQPPSEIFAIDNSYESFIELNTEVIGCSIDSYFTHRAWLNYDKNSNFKNLKFPLLADNNHKISKAYMMYSEKLGHSYRGFYIMDPEGIIFAIAVADLNVTIPLDEMFIRIRKHQERNSI